MTEETKEEEDVVPKKKESKGMKVCLRFRPQNKIEKTAGAYEVVTFSECGTMVHVQHPDIAKHKLPVKFVFDRVFGTCSPQPEVYQYTAAHLVEQLFDGFNATIFAYGQTGAGKTYSMEGELGSPHRGIVPRIVERLFEKIEDAPPYVEFLLKISYVEIYLERLRDLFEPDARPLKIRESKFGIYIEGVCELYVGTAEETLDMMTVGSDNRTVAGTGMNAVSSRSHGVFMLKLEQKHMETGTKKMSKLMMVDLAGSEKVSKTKASGTLLEQAKKINQSLSALGNVMNALSSGKKHISYRDSVLTRLLSDSLGGNCKTTLLIACSPSSYNADETITTCRFGARAKKIVNKAKVNVDKTVAEYKKDIEKLQKHIEKLNKSLKASQKKARRLKKRLDAAVAAGFDPGDGDDSDAEKKAEAEAASLVAAAAAVVEEEKRKAWRLQKQEEMDEALKQVSVLKDIVAKCTCQDQAQKEAALRGDDTVVGGVLEDMVFTATMSVDPGGVERALDAAAMGASPPSASAMARSPPPALSTSAATTTASVATTGGTVDATVAATLVENARRPLLEERSTLVSKCEQLSRQIMGLHEKLQVKDSQLKAARLSKEETEARCDTLMVDKEFGEETSDGQKHQIKRLKQNEEEFTRQLRETKRRMAELVQKVELTERESEERIHKIHLEQEKLAKELVENARKEILKYKRRAESKTTLARSSVRRARGRPAAGMSKMRDQYVASIKEAKRLEEDYESKLREFEETALDNMYQIKMEHVKMSQSLEAQTHQYLKTKMALAEVSAELDRVSEVIAAKDRKIAQQNQELELFGLIKREIEKKHKEERMAQLQNIARLKEQIKVLEAMGSFKKRDGAVALKSDVSALAMKKRRQVARPMRGRGARPVRPH